MTVVSDDEEDLSLGDEAEGEIDFDRTFHSDLIATGFDALWCADFRLPCLVRVDPATFEGSVHLELPAISDPDSDRWQGPGMLKIGLGGIWILDRVGSLVSVDPAEGSFTTLVPPFPFTDMAIGPDAIFGIGESGDGRLGRITPDGDIEVATVGQSLRLVAVTDGLAWTVDDAAARILAIDSRSLEIVQRFEHLGAPECLWPQGRKCWYLSGREVAHDGERASVMIAGHGFPYDLLALDADSGQLDEVSTIYSPSGLLEDPRGFWMSSEYLNESLDEDGPVAVSLVSRSGEIETQFDRPGQVDCLARDGTSLWISGFRVSRQQTVVTKVDLAGQTLGEASFGAIDVGRCLPEPEPIVWPPLEEWADGVRLAVERCLTEPNVSTNRYGEQSLVPPISERFHLGHVTLRIEDESAFLDVVFSWDGFDALFGRSYCLEQDDEIAHASDAYISVYLEEELMAAGLGVENATRDRRVGIDWLTWPRWDGET